MTYVLLIVMIINPTLYLKLSAMEEPSSPVILRPLHTDSAPGKPYTFLTSDEREVSLTSQEIEYCATLKHAVEDTTCDSQVNKESPLLPCSYETFTYIKPLLTLLAQEGTVSQAMCSLFNQQLPDPLLLDIFHAANYLYCKPILEACAKVLAVRARTKAKIDWTKGEQLQQSCLQACEWFDSLQLPYELSCLVGTAFLKHPATLKKPRILAGHADLISCICYGPQDTTCATGSCDSTIHLWDLEQNTLLKKLQGHTDWIRAVCYTKDGSRIISASRDKTMRIWNPESSECVAQLCDHTDQIFSLDYCPHNQQVVSGAGDETVRIWDLETTNCLRRIKRKSSIFSVRYNPQGRQCMFSCGRKIEVWDIHHNKKVQSLKGHARQVYALACCPDGRYLASCSRDGKIQLWDMRKYAPYKEFVWYKNSLRALMYSPCGMQLVACGDDKLLSIWDLNAERFSTIPGDNSPWALCYSSDGSQLAHGNKSLYITSLINTHGDLLEDWTAQKAVALHYLEKIMRDKQKFSIVSPVEQYVFPQHLVQYIQECRQYPLYKFHTVASQDIKKESRCLLM